MNKTLFDMPAKQKSAVPEQFSGRQDKPFDMPLAHSNDSTGSFQSADKILSTGRLSVQLRIVLDALKCHPNVTSAELAKIAVLDRYRVARRLPILATKGYAERSGERQCTICHCQCFIWRVVR
jgi:hypothetical protein